MRDERVAVYGAGISGLIAAFYLLENKYKVTVIDPYNEPKIKTLHLESGMVELAAGSILHNDEVKYLLDKMGLEYVFSFKEGKNKFVASNPDKISRWPLGFFETIKAFPQLYRLAKKSEKLKPRDNESLGEWVKRFSPVLGQKLIFPGLQGIYGHDQNNLSASLVLNNLFSNKKKSLGTISFKEGMESFSKALKAYLLKNDVEFLDANDKIYDFSIISTPAFSTPDIIKNKSIFENIKYQSITTTNIFIEEKDRFKKKGFGCVFEKMPEDAMGVIFESDLFEGRAKSGLVCEKWLFKNNVSEDALDKIKKIRKAYFKKDTNIKEHNVKYWDKAFPKYDLNLEKLLNKLPNEKNIYYFANWTGAMGIGSMIQKAPRFFKSIVQERTQNG